MKVAETAFGDLAQYKEILPYYCRLNLIINYLSYIYLGYFVCVSVCHNCGTLCYSFSFSNQTDQGDKTEGSKREGLEMER